MLKNHFMVLLSRNEINRETFLRLAVPPFWKADPEPVEVLEGRRAVLSCSAGGYPEPQILWRRRYGERYRLPSGPQDAMHLDMQFHYDASNASSTIPPISKVAQEWQQITSPRLACPALACYVVRCGDPGG